MAAATTTPSESTVLSYCTRVTGAIASVRDMAKGLREHPGLSVHPDLVARRDAMITKLESAAGTAEATLLAFHACAIGPGIAPLTTEEVNQHTVAIGSILAPVLSECTAIALLMAQPLP